MRKISVKSVWFVICITHFFIGCAFINCCMAKKTNNNDIILERNTEECNIGGCYGNFVGTVVWDSNSWGCWKEDGKCAFRKAQQAMTTERTRLKRGIEINVIGMKSNYVIATKANTVTDASVDENGACAFKVYVIKTNSKCTTIRCNNDMNHCQLYEGFLFCPPYPDEPARLEGICAQQVPDASMCDNKQCSYPEDGGNSECPPWSWDCCDQGDKCFPNNCPEIDYSGCGMLDEFGGPIMGFCLFDDFCDNDDDCDDFHHCIRACGPIE